MRMALIGIAALGMVNMAGVSTASAFDIDYQLSIGKAGVYITLGRDGPLYNRYRNYRNHHRYEGYRNRYSRRHVAHRHQGVSCYKSYHRSRHRKTHYHGYCKKPRRIFRKLRRQGWHDLHTVKIRNSVFKMRATDSHGYVHKLKVDRCSGKIIKARIIGNQHRGRHHWHRQRARYWP